MDRPNFAVFDTEGDAGKRGFVGCSTFSNDGGYWFDNPSDAISALRYYAQQGYILAAHNAEYDISVLFWQHDIPVEVVYYNGKFNCGRWKPDPRGKTTLIIDTVNLSGGLSVNSLGKAMRLPKLSTPQRLLGIDPNRYEWICETHNIGECTECYSIRDAEIVYRYLQHFADDLESLNVPFKKRIGAASVAVWRALDNVTDIAVKTKRLDNFCRDAYHGGRVEVFKEGKLANIRSYDIVSMYPSVMVSREFPDMDTIVNIEERNIDPTLIRFEGISRALVYQPQTHVPVLPVAVHNKLYFPVGTFYGTFTNVELREFQARGGTIKRIDRMAIATANVRPFTSFVGVLWAKRLDYKKHDDPREWVAKIMLNSLYGRLGLKRVQEREAIIPSPYGHSIEKHIGYSHEEIGNRLCCKLTSYPQGVSKESNVLWAAYITAYARIRLLTYLEQAGQDLVYCDTDSIITIGELADEGNDLGALSYKGMYASGTFIAPKMYMLEDDILGDIVRAKGVPQAVARDYIKYNRVEYQQPYRIRESWGSEHTPGSWRVVEKARQMVPSKRTVLNPDSIHVLDGFSDTIPITFSFDVEEEPLEID